MSALAVAVLGALVGFGAPPPRNAVRGVICVAPLAGFEREGKELRVAGNAAHLASAPPAVKRYALSIDGAITDLGDGRGDAHGSFSRARSTCCSTESPAKSTCASWPCATGAVSQPELHRA